MVLRGEDLKGLYVRYQYSLRELFDAIQERSVVFARQAAPFDLVLITEDERSLFHQYLNVVVADVFNYFLKYNLGIGRPIVPDLDFSEDAVLEFTIVDRHSLTDTVLAFDPILKEYLVFSTAIYMLNDLTKGALDPLFRAEAVLMQKAFDERLFYVSLGYVMVSLGYESVSQYVTGDWSERVVVQRYEADVLTMKGSWKSAMPVQERISEALRGSWKGPVSIQEEVATALRGSWKSAVTMQEEVADVFHVEGSWSDSVVKKERISEALRGSWKGPVSIQEEVATALRGSWKSAVTVQEEQTVLEFVFHTLNNGTPFGIQGVFYDRSSRQVIIDWGDGTVETPPPVYSNKGSEGFTHTYAAGTYNVVFQGSEMELLLLTNMVPTIKRITRLKGDFLTNLMLFANDSFVEEFDFILEAPNVTILASYKNIMSLSDAYAKSLRTIKKGHFSQLKSIESMEYLFNNNTELVADIGDIFDGANLSDVLACTSAFGNCSKLTGSGMAIIDRMCAKSVPVNHAGCFYNCTGLDDYDLIPDDWK